MDGPTLKRKIKVNFTTSNATSSPPSHTNATNISRPASPLKHYSSTPPSPTNFRPKAKVNSSATIRRTPSVVSYSSSHSSARPGTAQGSTSAKSANSTPRAGSPFKSQSRVANGTLSPTFQPKVQSKVTRSDGVRPQTAGSTPATPEYRSRSLTTTDPGRSIDSGTQRPNTPLHHAMSFSSLQPLKVPSLSGSSRSQPNPDTAANLSDVENTGSHTVRITSKVTGMAKYAGDNQPTVPSHLSTVSNNIRARAPSISSNVSPQTSGSPPVFYPITTATPAANPYKYPPPMPVTRVRMSPVGVNSRRDDSNVTFDRPPGFSKVDPSLIPQSPSVSALSFSSRSSTSYASESLGSKSSTDTHQENGTLADLRVTLDNLVRYSAMASREEGSYSGDSGQDRDAEDAGNDEERKLKAEAKSNRKIADLEITNRSLLAINASLETARNRQAKEIRDLRRKLRESRLILPPRTYRAVKSSQDVETVEEDEDQSDEEEIESGDQVYARIKIIIENLLVTGQRAIEKKEEDVESKGTAKVLTAEEVRSWHDSNGGDIDHVEEFDHDEQYAGVANNSVPRIESIDNLRSGRETARLSIPNRTRSLSLSPPPILITESS